MKAEVDLRALEPSNFSAVGFLGSDTRPLDAIIEEDLAVLREADAALSIVAEALEAIHRAARASLGAEVSCGPGLFAVHHDSRAQLPCPFGDGLFEKGETVLADRGNGREFLLTFLSIHLIRDHGFFQGRGSRYRIEPSEAITIVKRLNL